MAKVLSISSQVVYGHVGNSVSTFVLQRMGHEVHALPTVLLSNRPGYAAMRGKQIEPDILHSILEAGFENGWLSDIDAIITGYLPSEHHVELCRDWISRIKAHNKTLTYLCDPIVGDEPGGIYIDSRAAGAMRSALLPLADIITPNSFELGWITGQSITSPQSAITAAMSLNRPCVLVTSAPSDRPELLTNLLVQEGQVVKTQVLHRTVFAHGTGDFFASIYLALILQGVMPDEALQSATYAMETVLDFSEGKMELALVGSQSAWAIRGSSS